MVGSGLGRESVGSGTGGKSKPSSPNNVNVDGPPCVRACGRRAVGGGRQRCYGREGGGCTSRGKKGSELDRTGWPRFVDDGDELRGADEVAPCGDVREGMLAFLDTTLGKNTSLEGWDGMRAKAHAHEGPAAGRSKNTRGFLSHPPGKRCTLNALLTHLTQHSGRLAAAGPQKLGLCNNAHRCDRRSPQRAHSPAVLWQALACFAKHPTLSLRLAPGLDAGHATWNATDGRHGPVMRRTAPPCQSLPARITAPKSPLSFENRISSTARQFLDHRRRPMVWSRRPAAPKVCVGHEATCSRAATTHTQQTDARMIALREVLISSGPRRSCIQSHQRPEIQAGSMGSFASPHPMT
jgi:hypothetical protein